MLCSVCGLSAGNCTGVVITNTLKDGVSQMSALKVIVYKPWILGYLGFKELFYNTNVNKLRDYTYRKQISRRA